MITREPRAKASLAMGLSLLNGDLGAAEGGSDLGGTGMSAHHPGVFRGQRLGLAESLFFESICVGLAIKPGHESIDVRLQINEGGRRLISAHNIQHRQIQM